MLIYYIYEAYDNVLLLATLHYMLPTALELTTRITTYSLIFVGRCLNINELEAFKSI